MRTLHVHTCVWLRCERIFIVFYSVITEGPFTASESQSFSI